MAETDFQPSDDVAAALEKVNRLDLSPINKKLRYDDAEFWTDARLAQAETAYRRFLALNLLYPDETVAVNGVLDEYWHSHILDTRKYAADCDEIFGALLHHFPYFGIEDEEDRQRKVNAFAVTQTIWEKAFGRSLLEEFHSAEEARLTLDKVLGGLDFEEGARADVFAAPKSCKNGQHCKKVIGDVGAEDSVVAVLEQ